MGGKKRVEQVDADGAAWKFARVALDRLVHTPWNGRTPTESDPKIIEMAASIRLAGDVDSPLLARPVGDKGEQPPVFEVRAGNRRLVAARLAGLETVSVRWREMDDHEAAAVTVRENRQREDLNPLEEASHLKMLMDAGGTLKEAADALGTTTQSVARRLALLNLTPAWRAAALDPGQGVSAWSAVMLEQIARLPEAMQKAFEKKYIHTPNEVWQRARVARTPLRELASDLAGNFKLLKHAKWDLDAADLVRSAPACSACPQRSDRQPDLFGDLPVADETKLKRADEGAHCLNSACWKKKHEAWLKSKAEALKAKHGDVRVVRGWSEKYIRSVKKETKGAVPHVKASSGAVTWAVPHSDRTPAPRGAAKKKEATYEELCRDAFRLRQEKIRAEICRYADTLGPGKKNQPPLASDECIAAVVAAFGLSWDFGHRSSRKTFADFDEAIARGITKNLNGLYVYALVQMAEDVEWNEDDREEALAGLRRLCGLLGADFESMWARACAEVPDPKPPKDGKDNKDNKDDEDKKDGKTKKKRGVKKGAAVQP